MAEASPDPFIYLFLPLPERPDVIGKEDVFFSYLYFCSVTVRRQNCLCDLRINEMLEEHYTPKSPPVDQNTEWVFLGGGEGGSILV